MKMFGKIPFVLFLDKKASAFTLAEILLSLTVIGIVAAIALPSLLGNANERAWETQKKALYTRFSQALPLLPSLNGYGQLEEIKNGDDTEILDTAAETFVRDGLSKVIKITNICDNDHLTDCGLPDKIIPINGSAAIELSDIKIMSKFNPIMTNMSFHDANNNKDYSYEQLDTKAASFETVNGESILVHYNPNCEPDLKERDDHYSQPKMCANFIYDLNGKKGPNTVGKDIGFITAMYSTDPIVVAPNPHVYFRTSNISYTEALSKCKENDNSKVPNVDEMTSMGYNKRLLALKDDHHWSSTAWTSKRNWKVSTLTGRRFSSSIDNSNYSNVYCIKR